MKHFQVAHRFFHLGVHVPFYLHFSRYIQFLGVQCTPLTLHLGVQRNLTAFSPHKVVHHAVFFINITQSWRKLFFCLTLGQTGSGVLSDPWSLCLSHHFFFVMLYITCQILFFIQNLMQDYLYIVMIIKQLN